MLMKMYVACRVGSLPPSDLCCPSAHACLLLSRFYWCFGPFSNRVLPGPGSVCCCCMINSVLLLYRRRCRRRRSRISFVLFALWFSLPEFTFFSMVLFHQIVSPLSWPERICTHLLRREHTSPQDLPLTHPLSNESVPALKHGFLQFVLERGIEVMFVSQTSLTSEVIA